MRKLKKNKKNYFVITTVLFFIALLTISTAYSFLNADLSLSGTVTTGSYGFNFNGDYEISYVMDNNWNSSGSTYYHITPTLVYEGDDETFEWKLYIRVPFDTEIVGCWSASSCVVEGEILTITSADHNAVLNKTNQSASPSFQMKTNNANYTFNAIGATFSTKTTTINVNNDGPTTIDERVDDKERTVVDYIDPIFSSTGGWGTTSTYKLNVTNNSDNTLYFWEADILFPPNSSVNTLWGGGYKYDAATGILSIEGPSWSQSLAPHQSVEVNVYMDTGQAAPYTPTLGKFRATTTTGEKIITSVVGGDS